MHGTNEFSAALSRSPTPSRHSAAATAATLAHAAPGNSMSESFAYLPLHSPVAGARPPRRPPHPVRPAQPGQHGGPPARPRKPPGPASTACSIPAYLAVHLGVAERLNRPRYLVLKGGGGEAERNPAKPATAHAHFESGTATIALPALDTTAPGPQDAAHLAAVWRGEARDPRAEATVAATVALGLIALGQADAATADAMAADLWATRR